jgi:hypothetical protein
MPKFTHTHTHTYIPNNFTAKWMFVFGCSWKVVKSWCHSGASTTPVNTHMVNWWCDAKREREREYYECEREVAHGMKTLARNRRWCKRNWRVGMAVPFIHLSSLLPHTYSYSLSWTHTLVPHQLVQQEGASNPKTPCPLQKLARSASTQA